MKAKKWLTKDSRNDYSILNSATFFAEDRSRIYLIFQPLSKYFQKLTRSSKIFARKHNRLSEKSFKTPVTSDNIFSPEMTLTHNGRMRTNFKGNCSAQDDVYFAHFNVVDVFIVYELGTWSRDWNTGFTLGDCLFGFVRSYKNPSPYGYIAMIYDLTLVPCVMCGKCMAFPINFRQYGKMQKNPMVWGKSTLIIIIFP